MPGCARVDPHRPGSEEPDRGSGPLTPSSAESVRLSASAVFGDAGSRSRRRPSRCPSCRTGRSSRAAAGRRRRRPCHQPVPRLGAGPRVVERARDQAREQHRVAALVALLLLPFSVPAALPKSSSALRRFSCIFSSVARRVADFMAPSSLASFDERAVELPRRAESLLEVLAELLVVQRAIEIRLQRLDRRRHLPVFLGHCGRPFLALSVSWSMTIRGQSMIRRPQPSHPLRCSHAMLKPKRILVALVAFVSALIYVWVAAVRAVPGVRAAEGGCSPEQGRGVDGGTDEAPGAVAAQHRAVARCRHRPSSAARSRSGRLARRRALPLRPRHRASARVGARALPVGRAQPGHLRAHAALVRDGQHRRRPDRPRRRLGARRAHRPGNGRERRLHRPHGRRAARGRRSRLLCRARRSRPASCSWSRECS